MRHEQNAPHPHRAWPGRLRAQLSFANVAAGLALFIALGGTAAAAVTLDRDSVGSPQIRTDAVRSPEIRADAVRSPEIKADAVRSSEIKADAVRSSEIRDASVNIGDISTGAQNALRAEVRFAENDNSGADPVEECQAQVVTECPDVLALALTSQAAARTAPGNPSTPTPAPGPSSTEPDRNWLVQAKLEIAVNNGLGLQGVTCGLVNRSLTGQAAVLDEAALFVQREQSDIENVTLSTVVKKRAGNPTLALRCDSPDGREVIATHAKIIAVEVGDVDGP